MYTACTLRGRYRLGVFRDGWLIGHHSAIRASALRRPPWCCARGVPTAMARNFVAFTKRDYATPLLRFALPQLHSRQNSGKACPSLSTHFAVTGSASRAYELENKLVSHGRGILNFPQKCSELESVWWRKNPIRLNCRERSSTMTTPANGIKDHTCAPARFRLLLALLHVHHHAWKSKLRRR